MNPQNALNICEASRNGGEYHRNSGPDSERFRSKPFYLSMLVNPNGADEGTTPAEEEEEVQR